MYTAIILTANVIIILVNYFFFRTAIGYELWQIALFSALATISVIAVDGLFAFLVRYTLPKKWFSPDKTCFSAGKKLKRFYEKIGVKKWKNLVPELGMFTSFSKGSLDNPDSVEYVERFILESNFGVMCHVADIVFGFMIFLFFPMKIALSICLPVSLVNAVLNYMPVCILRYNLNKLHVLRKFNLKKQKTSFEEKKVSSF